MGPGTQDIDCIAEVARQDDPSSSQGSHTWLALGFLILLSLAGASYPAIRAFYHFEVNYNEGWNIYNAIAFAHHVPLYGAKYGWTTVNYPALSFYVLGYLSRLTHDPLFAGRLLSLVSMAASCVLVGLFVQRLTRGLPAALFAGFYCQGLFCASAPGYVGANDPQLFAQVLFLAGLVVYLSRPPGIGTIAAVAVLFALGGNIKHTLIDFPLAVFLDLWFVSRRRAFQFVLFLGILGGISVWANTAAGGPFFVSNLLSGRSYSVVRALLNFAATNLALIVFLLPVGIWVLKKRQIHLDRLLSTFFFGSLLVGIVLSGGEGVSMNADFDMFLAISMIIGVLFHEVTQGRASSFPSAQKLRAVPIVLVASLILVFLTSGNEPFWRGIRELPQEEARFDREVSFLAKQPGPVICESLLRCYAAGKPYLYDPFNSQRFMRAGKLDSREIVQKIAQREYAAIQVSLPVKSFWDLRARLPHTVFHPVEYSLIQLGPFATENERFPEPVLQAVDAGYELLVEDPDCDIYVPRKGDAALRGGHVPD